MKKRTIWLLVLLLSLLLNSGMAKHLIRPPQTAGEVPVPDHTVPVVTNVQINGNDITVGVSGPFNQGGAIIYVTTPSGRTQKYVTFSKVGDTLAGTVTGLPPDALSWEMDTISIHMTGTPGMSMSCFYQPDGALQAYSISEGAVTYYHFDGEGRLTGYNTKGIRITYDNDGNLYQYTVLKPNGHQQYNGQYELTYEESTDPDTGTTTEMNYEHGVLMRRAVTLADKSQYEYDGQGTLRRSGIPGDSGTVTFNNYDENGKLHSYVLLNGYNYEQYDAAGNLVMRSEYDGTTQTYEEFENGQQVYKRVSGKLPDGRYYNDVFKNGVFTERTISEEDGDYHYDAKGKYTGKTVYDGGEFEFKTYDAKGALTEYCTFSDQQGGVWLTYNSRNVLKSLKYFDPYFYNEYRYDAKEKVWYLNGVRFDGAVPIDVSKLKLPTEIVWYPNNTVCSFGPQFRDIDPDLTKLWYMFTPIDLSRDGTQTFELIGGNMFVLGQVSVTVNGDSVTVTYSTVKGNHGHIYVKSEYLNFFPDLASVKTVVPEEIGEGFKFGETISIQNDLGGDTNVLMFIRNVTTFRNFVDKNTFLRRYYKNYPSRVTLRDAMLELMDTDP